MITPINLWSSVSLEQVLQQNAHVRALNNDVLALQEELLEAQERERDHERTIERLLALVDRLVTEGLRTRVVNE